MPTTKRANPACGKGRNPPAATANSMSTRRLRRAAGHGQTREDEAGTPPADLYRTGRKKKDPFVPEIGSLPDFFAA